MTKKEIVKAISEQHGLTQLKTKEIVQSTFDAIVEALVSSEEHRIELRNFGVFEVKKRAARKARNPRTSQPVDVPEKFVVTFKPGKEMEEKVRQLEIEAAQKRAAENQGESPHPDINHLAGGPDAPAGGQHPAAGGQNASDGEGESPSDPPATIPFRPNPDNSV